MGVQQSDLGKTIKMNDQLNRRSFLKMAGLGGVGITTGAFNNPQIRSNPVGELKQEFTNGWFGYMPTESAWPHGGYEVETVSPFTPSAARDLTELVVGYLQGEMQAERSPVQTKAKSKRRR